MKRMSILFFFVAMQLSLGSIVLAQDTAPLRFMCFQDGNECEIYADLLARISEDYPSIAVAVEVVAAEEVVPLLLAQVEAAEAPDIARVPDPGALAGHYLDLRPLLNEPELLQASFRSPYFAALRLGLDDEGLYGYPDALGMVAPFVNVSLFEQAGVAVPADGASWDNWLEALDQVVAATDASYALAVDNKDHRLVGPAMSLGAHYFDELGHLTLPDDGGLRSFLQILRGLMEEGNTPTDTLLGTGSSEAYFLRGETVMYICGSWKVEAVAAAVGSEFDWVIAPNPAGEVGGTGIAQSTSIVAFAGTDHPESVARVIDLLLTEATLTEFAARTLTIPAHEGVAVSAIGYQTNNDIVSAALNGFARQVPKLQDQAITLDLHPLAPVFYEASNANLRAYFAGDLTLDEAIANMKTRLLEAMGG